MPVDLGGAFIIGFILLLVLREVLSLAGVKRLERFSWLSNIVVVIMLVILAVIVLNRFSRALPW